MCVRLLGAVIQLGALLCLRAHVWLDRIPGGVRAWCVGCRGLGVAKVSFVRLVSDRVVSAVRYVTRSAIDHNSGVCVFCVGGLLCNRGFPATSFHTCTDPVLLVLRSATDL